jgi:hypothetical protein
MRKSKMLIETSKHLRSNICINVNAPEKDQRWPNFCFGSGDSC